MNFAIFYQSGGLFMHAITLLSIVGTILLVRRIRVVRAAFRQPTAARELLGRRDSLTLTTIVAALGFGALGCLMGAMEAAAAVATVPPAMQFAALLRGASILFIPGAWALMCALPLVLAHGGMRHVEHRLRYALDVGHA
jgi:uncharacterized membrane protein